MLDSLSPTTLYKAIAVIGLYLFLPLSVVSYYYTRRPRRVAEVDRILSILQLDASVCKAYAIETMRYYVWSLIYVSFVTCLGLALLFFGAEIGLSGATGIQIGNTTFPQQGSGAIFGIAFFGAYLWSLQHIFRRYSLNDLAPAVYYNIGIRMTLSGTIAVVIFNGYTALMGGGESAEGVTEHVWPAVAFLIGMFPTRGVRWLTDRASMLSSPGDLTGRKMPLEMIEGIEMHDVLRLEELGIDSCFDLALADFAPLALKTPYSSRQLVDWIMQAKLCVHVGDSIKDLRQRGVRTLDELETLSEEQLDKLAAETSVTRFSLDAAREVARNDHELKRLRELVLLIGRFWGKEDRGALSLPGSTPTLVKHTTASTK